ncbi:MAG: EpsI family protein [Bryobacterales bacterium]|nr:EpsI family protein [Bryobacterales bacterium]
MNKQYLVPVALVLLAAQAGLTYTLTRTEYLPSPGSLEDFPRAMAGLPQSRDSVLDPDAYEMLSPDDVLNRQYFDPASGANVQLFLAYYKTQLRAKNAHDPKVCLPGSGWNPQSSKVIEVQLDSKGGVPASLNHYVVSKGDQQIVVLYWFQTHKRAVALEQTLRFYRMVDTVRDNRTDMALVRIVTPVANGDVNGATERGLAFARELYPKLAGQFPAKVYSSDR